MTEGATPRFSKPTVLLTHLPFSRYDAASDGASGVRFVMSRPGGDWSPPTRVYVMTNIGEELRAKACV